MRAKRLRTEADPNAELSNPDVAPTAPPVSGNTQSRAPAGGRPSSHRSCAEVAQEPHSSPRASRRMEAQDRMLISGSPVTILRLSSETGHRSCRANILTGPVAEKFRRAPACVTVKATFVVKWLHPAPVTADTEFPGNSPSVPRVPEGTPIRRTGCRSGFREPRVQGSF